MAAETSIPVSRAVADQLRQLALDMSTAEGRRVTLGEAVGRLITAWRSAQPHDATRGNR